MIPETHSKANHDLTKNSENFMEISSFCEQMPEIGWPKIIGSKTSPRVFL